MSQSAISPTRQQDYPEWYQQVVKAADLAENSPVRGCMVIKPWGFGIWEKLQAEMDRRIKATGHDNAYFPLFIPLSFLQREAQHVEGFAKECAVVTHHRLELRDGKLVPTGELEEPLIVRPTSETIIGESFAKWVQSYRDLPLLINQWCNVVRWEMRTRLFLRTSEFLWQEGHTAHATYQEALEETMRMFEVYRSFAEDVLAMPVIPGEKPAMERFPGAEKSFTVEAMMQDRKALQAGTSHYLGQNFARACGIKFLDQAGEIQYAHTTSWGTSTRMVGGLIMTHSDDDGLRLPPRVAPKHIVICPVVPKPELESKVLEYAQNIAALFQNATIFGDPLIAFVDKREMRGGDKYWHWVKRGIPLIIEVGPRDIDSNSVVMYRRDKPSKQKINLAKTELVEKSLAIMSEMQKGYLESARAYRDQYMETNISGLEEFKKFFTPKSEEKPEIHGGFVKAKWSEDPASAELLADLKVTIRCLPLEQDGKSGKCVLTGKPASKTAIFAKAY